MTPGDFYDFIAIVAAGGMGGLVAWVLRINNKVVAQVEKIKNIQDADTKTSDAIDQINRKLDAMQMTMTKICTKLEIQEVPIEGGK